MAAPLELYQICPGQNTNVKSWQANQCDYWLEYQYNTMRDFMATQNKVLGSRLNDWIAASGASRWSGVNAAQSAGIYQIRS